MDRRRISDLREDIVMQFSLTGKNSKEPVDVGR